MLAVQLKRTVNINNDVANNQPSCKQDCRDVVNISVFLMVLEIMRMLIKKKKMVQSCPFMA